MKLGAQLGDQACAPSLGMSTQFHENCDSAVKIDFLMKSGCSLPKSCARSGPVSTQIIQKIAIFTAVKIGIFMKLGAH